MSNLTTQRCFNHGQREAVARCASCGNYFCRECITEHAGRMTCARCLDRPTVATGRFRLLGLMSAGLQLGIGLLISWFCFFVAGRLLLAIPSTFHEGTIWSLLGILR